MIDAGPLTTPPTPSRVAHMRPVRHDASGVVYLSVNAAADAHGVARAALRQAIRHGWKCRGTTWTDLRPRTDVEKRPAPAAPPTTGRPSVAPVPVQREDTGEVYPSQSAAARAIGVSLNHFITAMRAGRRCRGTRWSRPGETPVPTSWMARRLANAVSRTQAETDALFLQFEGKIRAIARKFVGRFCSDELTTFDDAYADGCVGLLRAITRRFDERGRGTFEAFVVTWIKRTMLRGVRERHLARYNARCAGFAFNVVAFSTLDSAGGEDFDFADTIVDEGATSPLDRIAADSSYDELTSVLDFRDRDLFKLRFVFDRTHAEIASELDMELPSVDRRFDAGLALIRENLSAASAAQGEA